MTKAKKPSNPVDWEKVCNNLDAALRLSIRQEDELIAALEELKAAHDDLTTTLIKSAGIIQYLEMKLERANSV